MQYVSLSGFTRGNQAAETGINLNGISARYFSQFKDKVNDFQGVARGFAIPDKLDLEVSVDGEVSGATGLMAVKFITAYVFANTGLFGVFEASNGGGNSGGLYADEATVASSRDGWKTVSQRFSSNPNIT